MDLGRSWAPFGKGLGGSGRCFWRFLAVFGVLNHHFFNYRSKMGSKRPFGSILKGSGRVFGGFAGFLDRFWKVLGGFGKDFGQVWAQF